MPIGYRFIDRFAVDIVNSLNIGQGNLIVVLLATHSKIICKPIAVPFGKPEGVIRIQAGPAITRQHGFEQPAVVFNTLPVHLSPSSSTYRKGEQKQCILQTFFHTHMIITGGLYLSAQSPYGTAGQSESDGFRTLRPCQSVNFFICSFNCLIFSNKSAIASSRSFTCDL